MNEPKRKTTLYRRLKRWRQTARRFAGRVLRHQIKLIHEAITDDSSKHHRDNLD